MSSLDLTRLCKDLLNHQILSSSLPSPCFPTQFGTTGRLSSRSFFLYDILQQGSGYRERCTSSLLSNIERLIARAREDFPHQASILGAETSRISSIKISFLLHISKPRSDYRERCTLSVPSDTVTSIARPREDYVSMLHYMV